MTVLNRLVQKSLLERRLDGRAYRYHASLWRDEFLRSAADEVVHQYIESFGGNATEYLADAVDAVAPRPARAAFEDVPPPPLVHEPAPRQAPIAAILLTALALQIVTFFLARRGVR